MALTFIDAGALIAAARGTDWISRQAILVLNDSRRSFAASPFLRLEVLPKAVFHKKHDEVAFYAAFFAAVERWAEPSPKLVEAAESLASQFGLAALDALHVAAALAVNAEEIYTTERREKPIHRVSGIQVRSIHPG